MSTIQDMNNRIKQNRAQRPSKRPKFKENNRESIYKAHKKRDSLSFKTLPKSELDKLKERIQERAVLDMKKEGASQNMFSNRSSPNDWNTDLA